MDSKTCTSYGTVKISTDRDYLRLQFSSKISQAFYGKRQYFKSLGRKDNPTNRRWAEAIASRIQTDLDHPDGLFDPSLQKYLALRLNGELVTFNQITIGELWDEFVDHKYRTGQLAETTYLTIYKRTYAHWLAPYTDELVNSELADTIIFELLEQEVNTGNLKKFVSALERCCNRAIVLGKLTQNPFLELSKTIKDTKKSQQLLEAENYKAFTLEERNTIVNAFALSERPSDRHIGSLIAFLFLTGCRIGEALAFKFKNIRPDFIIFDESYSTEARITKTPKTNTIRLFKTTGYDRLNRLLSSLQTQATEGREHVFVNTNGNPYDRFAINAAWYGKNKGKKGKKDNNRYSLGVVKRLAEQNQISQYLKPSATRHTFISLQVQSGTNLKFLADSVGNSVDTIYKHYLDPLRDATFKNL